MLASLLSKAVAWHRTPASSRVAFRCNICGARNEAPGSAFHREASTCTECRSSVRMRGIVHLVSMAVFGRSLALPDFPVRKDIRGIGLSDWPPYADRLAERLSYTNTYYHTEPFLDITAVPEDMAGSCDFVISTDVFEHVLPPVSAAFRGAHKLLKPGATLVLTVPFAIERSDTREHFPHLHKFEILGSEAEGFRLRNTRADGAVEEFDNLVFHGGPGDTLELREFAKDSVRRELQDAGFTDIRFTAAPVPEYGIFWIYPWSVPVTARAAGPVN